MRYSEAHLLGSGILLEKTFLDLFADPEYVGLPLHGLKNQTTENSLALLIRWFPSLFILCALRREAWTPDLSMPFGKDRDLCIFPSQVFATF